MYDNRGGFGLSRTGACLNAGPFLGATGGIPYQAKPRPASRFKDSRDANSNEEAPTCTMV